MTEDKFNDLRISHACDCADEILRLVFKGQIDEFSDGCSYYTKEAQDVFNEIYDMVEGTMIDFAIELIDNNVSSKDLEKFN